MTRLQPNKKLRPKEQREREGRYSIIDSIENEYRRAVKEIIIFPGSVAEYERFKEYPVGIVDTNRRYKGIILTARFGSGLEIADDDPVTHEFRNYLVDSGVEAIVNASWNERQDRWEGLPVRKKKEGK